VGYPLLRAKFRDLERQTFLALQPRSA
jgi:hypothetical protein